MKSLLQFLVFVAVISAAVAVLYLWKSGSPAVAAPVAISSPTGTPAAPASLKLDNLAAIDREFTQLVAAVVPSVVSIHAVPAEAADPRARILHSLFGGSGNPSASPQLGSGAIISDDGHIATNWHVISAASAVDVQLHDGRLVPAKFVGGDPRSDVAILKIETDGLRPISFADSDAASVGQMVFAVGNLFGLSETVTRGIISAKGRRTSTEFTNEFLQTDAPINPGNSGGPLVDLNGQLVGLNNSVLLADGIGFAIPSNTVRRIYENIRRNGRLIRPWFGVVSQSLTRNLAAQLGLPDAAGAIVAPVQNSPAARAGVQYGDVVVSFNGRPIRDAIDLRNRIAETEPGQTVDVGIRRQGRETTLSVVIEKHDGE
ncbi:MAG: trypsin-like peptidase domain-containing protein [Terrimicrobiaceae bacterium]|nr:trypsin-like peptidase domain-containing protein [Terrimicrobiaceae bacterium]